MAWNLRCPGASRASLVAFEVAPGYEPGQQVADVFHGGPPKRGPRGSSSTAKGFLALIAGVLVIAAIVTLPGRGPRHNAVTVVRSSSVLLAAPPVSTPMRTAPPILASRISEATVAPKPPVRVVPVASTTTAVASVTRATIPPRSAVTTFPVRAASVSAPLPSTADECAAALAYLAVHAKPGFAHYCRPGPLNIGVAHTVAYTCVPGTGFRCPDGGPEIIIANPACAISYENESSNSYWDFSSAGVVAPGVVQNGRTWDPYGECP